MVKMKLIEPKKMKVPAGPRFKIKIGPRELVMRTFKKMKAFNGPQVKGKQVSTAWLKAIGPREH